MQFLVQGLVAFGPIDVSINVGVEECQKTGQEMLECFLPGRVEIAEMSLTTEHGAKDMDADSVCNR